jgi:hypothetical protein
LVALPYFSGFIRMHNPEQHNAELEEATRNLITDVVPNFAPELAKLIAEVRHRMTRSSTLMLNSQV